MLSGQSRNKSSPKFALKVLSKKIPTIPLMKKPAWLSKSQSLETLLTRAPCLFYEWQFFNNIALQIKLQS